MLENSLRAKGECLSMTAESEKTKIKVALIVDEYFGSC